MQAVLIVLPIFLIIALGWVLRQKNFFTPQTMSENNSLLYGFAMPALLIRGLEEMRQNALKSGILQQADENARQILTSIVAATGMEPEIVFDDGEREVLRLGTPASAGSEKAAAERPQSVASARAS